MLLCGLLRSPLRNLSRNTVVHCHWDKLFLPFAGLELSKPQRLRRHTNLRHICCHTHTDSLACKKKKGTGMSYCYNQSVTKKIKTQLNRLSRCWFRHYVDYCYSNRQSSTYQTSQCSEATPESGVGSSLSGNLECLRRKHANVERSLLPHAPPPPGSQRSRSNYEDNTYATAGGGVAGAVSGREPNKANCKRTAPTRLADAKMCIK